MILYNLFTFACRRAMCTKTNKEKNSIFTPFFNFNLKFWKYIIILWYFQILFSLFNKYHFMLSNFNLRFLSNHFTHCTCTLFHCIHYHSTIYLKTEKCLIFIRFFLVYFKILKRILLFFMMFSNFVFSFQLNIIFK